MGTKANARVSSAIQLQGGEDQKTDDIVHELDRFFKLVHADIEDWKFSMEDYGDGPRIFVRFQIHVNKSGVPLTPLGAVEKQTLPKATAEHATPVSIPATPTPLAPPALAERTPPSGRSAATRRADLDLASFVEHWRSTRDNNAAAEFHKEGAPYLDAGSHWTGEKRSSGDAPGEHTDEEPSVSTSSN